MSQQPNIFKETRNQDNWRPTQKAPSQIGQDHPTDEHGKLLSSIYRDSVYSSAMQNQTSIPASNHYTATTTGNSSRIDAILSQYGINKSTITGVRYAVPQTQKAGNVQTTIETNRPSVTRNPSHQVSLSYPAIFCLQAIG